jgi:hypothetical protein
MTSAPPAQVGRVIAGGWARWDRPADGVRGRLREGAGLGLLLLGFAVARWYPFYRHGPFCAFRRLTGFPCPTCGFTRAFVYLTHGEWAPVLRDCPAAVPFFLAAVLAVAALAAGLALGIRIRPGPRWTSRAGLAVWGTVVALLLAHWGWRLATGRA